MHLYDVPAVAMNGCLDRLRDHLPLSIWLARDSFASPADLPSFDFAVIPGPSLAGIAAVNDRPCSADQVPGMTKFRVEANCTVKVCTVRSRRNQAKSKR